jgi:carboxypeptidase C (cathepsin A)
MSERSTEHDVASTGNDDGKRPLPDERECVTRHRTTIGGKSLEYTATAGVIHLRNENRKATAAVFYVALTADADEPSERPLTFCFNGGPGSSTVWLQMGAFGPKRIDLPDTVAPPPPPYRLVDNEHGILDLTDLVFIDPVDTGFSRSGGEGEGKDFYNVPKDVEAVSEFIRRYLSRNHRWNSPRFLAGESYGTTRAAALALNLQQKGIVLNGMVLLSLALNFQTFVFEAGNELPYVLYLPSYAATAWYHGKLAEPHESLEALLEDVRRFAIEEYAPALLKGSLLPADEKRRIAERIAAYTGLDAELVHRLDLRVHYMRFAKALLGQPGVTVGRLDGRYVGMDSDPDHHRTQRDPSMDAPYGPYAALINDYLRRSLEFGQDDDYMVFNVKVNQGWSWAKEKGMGYVNAAEDLRKALVSNPHLKVLIANGYYDLATPFFGAEYTASHLNAGPELEKNVRLTYYEAGHMMYFHPPSIAKLREDVASFYGDSLQNGT